MAVLWHRSRNGRCYEVRSAGRTRRLYVDGVLHSQYNPRTTVTGSVWDLLMLPALLGPAGSVRRVLLLGLGGGTVVHLLRRFVRPTTLVAVEVDALHVSVAHRFFDVGGPGLRLHCADAAAWAAGHRGAPFDLVIDDIFGQQDGEPVRGIGVGRRWARTLCGLLTPTGTLVVNFPDRSELLASALVAESSVSQRFPSAYALSAPHCDNAVGAFCGTRYGPRALRQRVDRCRALDPVRKMLRFRVGSLWA